MSENTVIKFTKDPSTYLMPQWMLRLLEDCGEEAYNDDLWPMKLIDKDCRYIIWHLCMMIGVERNGIPGQACRIMERYLNAQSRLDLSEPISREEWEKYKRFMSSRFLIRVISCIQLATKMTCADVEINANTIVRIFTNKGRQLFTVNEINDSEFTVFRTLGFRVPLWTSMEAGKLLGVDVGLPQAMLNCIDVVINMAECIHDRLDRHVRWYANLEHSCPRFKEATRRAMRTLHLVAGCVAATARYFSFSGPDPVPRLAYLTRAPPAYIRCIRDVLLRRIYGLPMDSCSPSTEAE